MPAAGTKKIEIDGEVLYLPAEDVEVTTLARELKALEDQKETVDRNVRRIQDRLIEIGTKHRAADMNRRKIRLVTATGDYVDFEWKTENEVNPDIAGVLREKLKEAGREALFGDLFSTRITYKLSRRWNAFATTEQVAAVEALKPDILKAIHVKERRPSIDVTLMPKTEAAA